MQRKVLFRFFTIISFFIVLSAFSSCNKKEKGPEPDTTKPSIIGIWDIEKFNTIRYKEGQLMYNDTIKFQKGDGAYEFRADNKIVVTGSKVDNLEAPYELLEGNKIRIIGSTPDKGGIFDILELTDSKLSLSYEYSDDDGYGNVTTYLNKR